MPAWTQEYETGFLELDKQHRKIFDLIEHLTVLIEAPSADDREMQSVILFLETYAKEHFECEERCMAETNCPARDINKEAHQQFLAGVNRFKQDFAGSGQKREFLAILQASLRAWLRNHILRIDTALKGCSPKF